MIEVTLEEIVNCVTPAQAHELSAFSRLYQQPLPATESFKLRRIANQLQDIVKAFNDTKNALAEQLGTKVEGSESEYALEPDSVIKFNSELKTLLSKTETIQCEPIKLSSLNDAKISAADLMVLEWLIVE